MSSYFCLFLFFAVRCCELSQGFKNIFHLSQLLFAELTLFLIHVQYFVQLLPHADFAKALFHHRNQLTILLKSSNFISSNVDIFTIHPYRLYSASQLVVCLQQLPFCFRVFLDLISSTYSSDAPTHYNHIQYFFVFHVIL